MRSFFILFFFISKEIYMKEPKGLSTKKRAKVPLA